MEPASREAVSAVTAQAPLTPKSPKKISHKHKPHSFPNTAIAAAAIAAVTISASKFQSQKRLISDSKSSRASVQDSSATEFQTQRRRNRKHVAIYDTVSSVYKQPEHNCRFNPSALSMGSYKRNSVERSARIHGRGSSSDSFSKSKPCVYCLETLTKENECNCCIEDTAHVQSEFRESEPQPVSQPFGRYPKSQVPEQECPILSQYPVCYALHECCCDHQSPPTALHHIEAVRAIPVSSYSTDQPSSSEYIRTTDQPMETCCVQRIRHSAYASPIANSSICRKKIHPAHETFYDCQACWSQPQTQVRTLKTLKAAKCRSKEQRVQARRIRHPLCEDSNSESELGAPVVDVRRLHPSSSRLISSSPPGRTKPFYHNPAKPLLSAGSSSSPTVTKVYSCSGPFQTCTQANLCVVSPSANPNVHTNYGPTSRLPFRGQCTVSTSTSSDSSSTSDSPETSTSSSTSSSSSTDLSDSSTSSDYFKGTGSSHQAVPYACPHSANAAASTSKYNQHEIHVRNPIHTCYHNLQVGPIWPRGSSLPISSGDFWNVRHAWPRNRTTAKYGRSPDVLCNASRRARNADNHPAHRAECICMLESTSSSTVQSSESL